MMRQREKMVAYNLLVGGTETAGLGHSANCRGALHTHLFACCNLEIFLPSHLERRSFRIFLSLLLPTFEHKVLKRWDG